MLLIDQLKQQNNFSDTEKIVANYILNNMKKAAEINIKNLAADTFCSVATISRFCKKLGYESSHQFKIRLASEIASSGQNERIAYDFPFDMQDSPEGIAESIKNLSIQTLNDSFSDIDINLIKEAAYMIDKAQQIDIYANGNSLVPAIDLHNKLLWMGKNSNLELIRGFQRLKADALLSQSVAIVFSYYGMSDRSIGIVKTLESKKIPYILITGPKLNPLCIHAKIVIHVPPVEEFIYKMAPISSRVAMTYVSDLLYSILFSFHYENNKNILAKHEIKRNS